MLDFLKKKKKTDESEITSDAVIITLMPGETTTYGKVSGFFKFRDRIYYRAKGSSGREIEDGKTFTESIKELYPSEFSNKPGPEISNIEVEQLDFTNVIK